MKEKNSDEIKFEENKKGGHIYEQKLWRRIRK